MWIERKVEGDRVARIRLDESPTSVRKVRIKATKHALWLVVAFWTGFSFIGYFAPIRSLVTHLFAFTLGPWQWFWLFFYSLATWANAGFLREQVCKYMCPYARFQSVMVDRDTLVVTYDSGRGEPRGARSRKRDHRTQGMGDCVDCSICVQVCPTGIDIRQGLQYMCIGCGACVDACNQVMDKLEYPRGLIRYTSERAVLERLSPQSIRKNLLRPRVLIYAILMFVLVAVFIGAMATRTTLRVDVIRDRGVLGREVPGGLIENVYRIQLMNASEQALVLSIGVEGIAGMSVALADRTSVPLADSQHAEANQKAPQFSVPRASNRLIAVVVRAPAETGKPGSQAIKFITRSLDADGSVLTEIAEASSFIFPN
jgi:cytochrome c oxidase accessory protein FixG